MRSGWQLNIRCKISILKHPCVTEQLRFICTITELQHSCGGENEGEVRERRGSATLIIQSLISLFFRFSLTGGLTKQPQWYAKLFSTQRLLKESCVSPPLLCCCGSWDWLSTWRFCPMIQPLRGLYRSCTQQCAVDRSAAAPAFLRLWQNPVTRSFLLLFLLSALLKHQSLQSCPLPPLLRPSFPPSMSWTPSPTHSITLPPWLQNSSAFTTRCLQFLLMCVLRSGTQCEQQCIWSRENITLQILNQRRQKLDLEARVTVCSLDQSQNCKIELKRQES